MKWCTRALIHFDRVGSAWLIVRFVDPEAQFVFLTPDEPIPNATEPFGLPGVLLAAQDGETTTFDRVLACYGLNSPALRAMATVISDTVKHVMHDTGRAALGSRDPHVLGFLTVTEGVMLDAGADADCLARSLPLFDALHTRMQAQLALDGDGLTPLDETRLLVAGVAALRAAAIPFSVQAFAATIRKHDERASYKDSR